MYLYPAILDCDDVYYHHYHQCLYCLIAGFWIKATKVAYSAF